MSDHVHFEMTREEHIAARGGGYVDPARYNPSSREYRPEPICRNGSFHARSGRDWSAVTCPACLSVKLRSAA